MSSLSTHVLDTARGLPAGGIRVVLRELKAGQATELASADTDQDGRVGPWSEAANLSPGRYELIFEAAPYHARLGVEGFYPEVSVRFEITDAAAHYHVPLLLSPYGYATYRGS